MSDPFKSLFPRRKPLFDKKNGSDQPQQQNTSTFGFRAAKKPLFKREKSNRASEIPFVDDSLYRKGKAEKVSDIPFVESPLYGKKSTKEEVTNKQSSPFLFPKGIPKKSDSSFFRNTMKNLYSSIEEAGENFVSFLKAPPKPKKDTPKRKPKHIVKPKATVSTTKPQRAKTVQHKDFDRLREIYEKIYEEQDIILSFEEMKNNPPSWKKE